MSNKRIPGVKVHHLQEPNMMHVCPIHLATICILYGFPQLFQTNNTNEPVINKFKFDNIL